jgi:hypothetical protein
MGKNGSKAIMRKPARKQGRNSTLCVTPLLTRGASAITNYFKGQGLLAVDNELGRRNFGYLDHGLDHRLNCSGHSVAVQCGEHRGGRLGISLVPTIAPGVVTEYLGV